MPLAVKLTLVTNNFLDVVAELIVEKIVAPRSKIVELLVVADKLSAIVLILVVGMPSAVQPTLATHNLLFVVIELMAGQIVAPQAKIAELLVVTFDPSTAHPWLEAGKFLADKSLVDGPTSVADSPSAAELILVADRFAIADLEDGRACDATCWEQQRTYCNLWATP
jgi:hypothetical protein